jgi:hypothetical protein
MANDAPVLAVAIGQRIVDRSNVFAGTLFSFIGLNGVLDHLRFRRSDFGALPRGGSDADQGQILHVRGVDQVAPGGVNQVNSRAKGGVVLSASHPDTPGRVGVACVGLDGHTVELGGFSIGGGHVALDVVQVQFDVVPIEGGSCVEEIDETIQLRCAEHGSCMIAKSLNAFGNS